MSIFKPSASDYKGVEVSGKKFKVLSTEAYNRFDPSLLGLGDIKLPSDPTDAIAAVFDLQGFTHFCRQIEPQLTVPLFLNRFLNWLFEQIRSVMTFETHPDGVRLYGSLPFFVKFMGDGLLALWDASTLDETGKRNVITSARVICKKYSTQFFPEISKKVAEPPDKLRCGLARGIVYSVGNGNDFVGSCINMAARLEKLPGVTFAFNRRGFDLEPEDGNIAAFFKTNIVVKKVSIRGIGDGELIGIVEDEFDKMKPADKALFKDP